MQCCFYVRIMLFLLSRATSSNTHMDIKSLSASQISSRKHDSIIGGVSEHESQIADGALEISLAEQESEATSVSASQVLQDSFPVPELPHACMHFCALVMLAFM